MIRVRPQNPGHPWWDVAEVVVERLVGSHDLLLRGERVALVTPEDRQGALDNPLEVAEGALDIGVATPSVHARMAAECSLDDSPIGMPVPVVHGARDDLVGVEEAGELARVAGDPGELAVRDDGMHCCYHRYLELRPSTSDWLARQLQEETTWRLAR